MNESKFILRQIESLADPRRIFGLDEARGKSIYRELSMRFHPDTNASLYADDEFNIMQSAYDNWQQAMEKDDPPLLRADEVASSFMRLENFAQESKVVNDRQDADLLANEASILTYLHSLSPSTNPFYDHIPAVAERQGDRIFLSYRRRMLDRHAMDFVTLNTFNEIFQDEVSIYDLGWIWNRILRVLEDIHFRGIVHGGITPDSVLIGPQEHDLIIANWYFSTYAQAPFTAVSSDWIEFYPALLQTDALNLTPQQVVRYTVPELDVCMAAQTMEHVFPNMPAPLEDYFSVLSDPDLLPTVITDIDILRNNFDRVIYHILGWQRRYIPTQWINWHRR